MPGMKDDKPTDALFRAFAVVPMTGRRTDGPRVGFPVDMEKLIRLVNIESET